VAESKAAVTRIAPNGIFSQVKTSAYFKATQQTPTLTSSSSFRLQQRNTGTTPQISQQQRLPPPPPPPVHSKPSIAKPQAPQRPPPPPSSSQQNRSTKTTSASRGPPPIPPRPARLAKNTASTLPPLPTPPLPPHSTNTNATLILEADLTMLRGATSSSNIMNSTKIDETCNLQPIIPPPPLLLVAPRLSITQMVNAVEQSNVANVVISKKETDVLTNKMENTSIILTRNDEMKSPQLASIEMKTPGSSSASNHQQQTPKSVTMDFKAMRRSGHELKEFLNSGRDEESVKKSPPQKEIKPSTSSIESDLDAVVVKDIKYYRNLVRTIFLKFYIYIFDLELILK
jgi:hypothetical protein